MWSKAGRTAYSVIKGLSGNPNGIYLHFSQLTPELVAEKQPAFIVLSPQGTPWCRYSGETGVALQNFLWMLPLLAEEMNIPILGICGGHQALALGFGGKVGPIRAAEDDCLPYSRERQSGVVPLTLTAVRSDFRRSGRKAADIAESLRRGQGFCRRILCYWLPTSCVRYKSCATPLNPFTVFRDIRRAFQGIAPTAES